MQSLVELRDRLAQIDAERAPLVRLIEAYEAYEAVASKPLRNNPQVDSRMPTARRASPTMDATIKAVTRVLEAGGPMMTGAILERLEDRAVLNLMGGKAGNVLSARLSNSPKFETKRGVGWWFADRAWPDENGALDGYAASAPEAEGGATPSNESLEGHNDLLG